MDECGTAPEISTTAQKNEGMSRLADLSAFDLAWIIYNDHVFVSRVPRGQTHPHTALTALVFGLWIALPQDARRILRAKIYLSCGLGAWDLGVLRILAKRVAEYFPVDLSLLRSPRVRWIDPPNLDALEDSPGLGGGLELATIRNTEDLWTAGVGDPQRHDWCDDWRDDARPGSAQRVFLRPLAEGTQMKFDSVVSAGRAVREWDVPTQNLLLGGRRGRASAGGRAIAAVVLDSEFRVISAAVRGAAPFQHAETMAVFRAVMTGGSTGGPGPVGATDDFTGRLPLGGAVVCSLEPCVMCAAMILHFCRDLKGFSVFYLDPDPGPRARNTVLIPGTETYVRALDDWPLLSLLAVRQLDLS